MVANDDGKTCKQREPGIFEQQFGISSLIKTPCWYRGYCYYYNRQGQFVRGGTAQSEPLQAVFDMGAELRSRECDALSLRQSKTSDALAAFTFALASLKWGRVTQARLAEIGATREAVTALMTRLNKLKEPPPKSLALLERLCVTLDTLVWS